MQQESDPEENLFNTDGLRILAKYGGRSRFYREHDELGRITTTGPAPVCFCAPMALTAAPAPTVPAKVPAPVAIVLALLGGILFLSIRGLLRWISRRRFPEKKQ